MVYTKQRRRLGTHIVGAEAYKHLRYGKRSTTGA